MSLDKCTEFLYLNPMHTVIETPAYLSSAKDENVSEEERIEIVSFLASNRRGRYHGRHRWSAKGAFRRSRQGKSGGYRIITFYADEDIPVFLLDIYSKDTQANLSKADRNELRKILTVLPQIWRESVSEQVKKLRSRK